MSDRFCHLHNHTEYSLLDGANRIPEMVQRAKEMEMDALAITDHGVMFGVVEFYLECKKAGIKPLLGVEAYVSPQGIAHRRGDGEKGSYHLLLLAKDLEGYRNLCKLSTIAALEGYYYKPRVDHDILRAHSKGVIATSACLGSEICQELLRENYDKAQYIAGMYKEMFGPDNFFIELQDHRLAEQARIRDPLIRIARELNLPLIATNDAHYLCKESAKPHDVLLCIQTGSLTKDEKRFKFETEEFFLKDKAEMAELFRDVPEALENTGMVADMCNVELDKRRADMPQPDVPEGVENFAYLRELAVNGLKQRRKSPEEALERLEYELGVIEKTGYGDYFLLVREFANVARQRGIQYGVRGSAAGSLVSYCIGITDVDPVEYGLTFERFLNPERISMPDVDMDFEDTRREEIIQYVSERFGKDHVAQIITFGTLGAKAAIKDCGRVQGYTPQETDRLTKLIPSLPGWNLDRAYKEVDEFRQLVDSEPRYKELFADAKSVEGISRNAGVHAAGVVISREPLVDYIPLYRSNDGQPITAFEMGILEKIGMLKMDFLGLSNLTVLARTIEHVKKQRGITIDPLTIADGDAATYEMLGRGKTIGVFQLEGGGMTRWVSQLKPNSIRELAAMVALYRPGPMTHIPRFIDTKFGRKQAEFVDERMRPILEETYGVIVYQDQVMQLVQAIAGFTLGKADVLRRAMGKKDVKAMAEMKVEFMDGTAANGVAEKNADDIWEMLLPFAGYAFNKAHAVCYAILAYQTAYLKATYPVEYMTALLSVYLSREDKVTTFIEECRHMKIPVLPPDVNASFGDFSIEKRGKQSNIRFGLVAIKGVGEGLVEGIVANRVADGPFQHLYEFAERTKPSGMNKTALEALIKAGALDSIDSNRKKLLEHSDGALQYAEQQNRDRLAGQDSLFPSEGGVASSFPALPEVDPLGRHEKLAQEKEVMGIYVSDHPLRGMERAIRNAATHRCADIGEMQDGATVKLGGVISRYRPTTTKAGAKMCHVAIEDFSGVAEGIIFAGPFEKLKDKISKDAVVCLVGNVQVEERGAERTVKIRVRDVEPIVQDELALALDPNAMGLVTITFARATQAQVRSLAEIIDENPGGYDCMIQIVDETPLPPILLTKQVDPSASFVECISKLVRGSKVLIEHVDAPQSDAVDDQLSVLDAELEAA